MDVFELLKTKCFDWNAIGRELRVHFDFREELKLETERTNASKLEKVIMKWVEFETCEVSWNSVIEMLERLENLKMAGQVKEYLLINPAAKKYMYSSKGIMYNFNVQIMHVYNYYCNIIIFCGCEL